MLAFYPADWSPVCGDQMALYSAPARNSTDRRGRARISVDGVWCHAAFAADRKLHLTLASDFEPKGEWPAPMACTSDEGGLRPSALRHRRRGHDPVELRLPGRHKPRRRRNSRPRSTPSRRQPWGKQHDNRALSFPRPSRTTLGPADTAGDVVEYGDFECPYCGEAYPILKAGQAASWKADAVRIPQFPDRRHASACRARGGSRRGGGEVAAEVLDMHDLMFEHQRHLDDASLANYAAQAGIDPAGVNWGLADREIRRHRCAPRLSAACGAA